MKLNMICMKIAQKYNPKTLKLGLLEQHTEFLKTLKRSFFKAIFQSWGQTPPVRRSGMN